MAGHTGTVAEGLGDVAFPDTGLSDETDIFSTGDESAGGKIENLGLWNLGVECKIEVFETLCMIKGRSAHSQLELSGIAALDLVGEEAKQKFGMRKAVLCGLPRAHLECLDDARQS